MSYTDPRTWVTGEIVSASELNTDLRDNMRTVLHVIDRLTATDSGQDGTFEDAVGMAAPVGDSEKWLLRFVFTISMSAGNGRIRFTFPTDGEIAVMGIWPSSSGTDFFGDFQSRSGVSPTGSLDFLGSADGIPYEALVTYVNGANPGNVQMQYAGNGGTPTIYVDHSVVYGVELL